MTWTTSSQSGRLAVSPVILVCADRQLMLESDITAAKGTKPKTKTALKAAAKKKRRAAGEDSDDDSEDDFVVTAKAKAKTVAKKASPTKSPAKRDK